MERFFQLNARKTTVKTELIAGMTTFFAMVYILMVNANIFSDPFGDGSNPLGVSYIVISVFCGDIKKSKAAPGSSPVCLSL